MAVLSPEELAEAESLEKQLETARNKLTVEKDKPESDINSIMELASEIMAIERKLKKFNGYVESKAHAAIVTAVTERVSKVRIPSGWALKEATRNPDGTFEAVWINEGLNAAMAEAMTADTDKPITVNDKYEVAVKSTKRGGGVGRAGYGYVKDGSDPVTLNVAFEAVATEEQKAELVNKDGSANKSQYKTKIVKDAGYVRADKV